MVTIFPFLIIIDYKDKITFYQLNSKLITAGFRIINREVKTY